jgi:5-methylcytosine-specific restriction endonuclease McrA
MEPNLLPRQICPECGKATEPGKRYCPAHENNNRALTAQADRNRRRRQEELKRLYDSWRWRGHRGTRRKILTRDPFCTIGILCDGRARSTTVDHVIRAEVYIGEHGGDESFFYDHANLRGCCDACHSHKTALENAGKWDEKLVPPLPPAVKALREMAERESEFTL